MLPFGRLLAIVCTALVVLGLFQILQIPLAVIKAAAIIGILALVIDTTIRR
jgi:hypothetical protein